MKSPRDGALEPIDTNTEGCYTEGSPERLGGSLKIDGSYSVLNNGGRVQIIDQFGYVQTKSPTRLAPIQGALPKL